jgi:hypothetical protein
MSDPTPVLPSPPAQPEKPQPTDAGHVPMTEEFDSAKWSLPPVVPVLIAAAIVAIVVVLFTWHSSKPLISAKVLGAYATQAAPSQVLVGVQLSVQNATKGPIWIKSVSVEVKPIGADKPLSDHAAPASDLDRYLQAFPELAAHKMPPMNFDEKLQPGDSTQGMVIVSFPLSKDAFDKRQQLKVTFEMYDHLPFTITQ